MGSFNHHSTYDQDFYAWAIENAELLRQKKFEQLDIDNLSEEIESMGKSNKREFMSRLATLLAHLLKWQYQPERRSNSWKLTIKNQRFDIEDLLQESPSLKSTIENPLDHAYKKALILAAGETGIKESDFPLRCPFTLAQCLDNGFLPD